MTSTGLYKRIAVVGNANPDRDYSDDIDAADCIIRFNACDHYPSGNVGTETHILCIRSFGSIGRDFAEGTTTLNPDVLDSCDMFWFVGEVGQWQEKITGRYKISGKPRKLFRFADMQAVDRKLNDLGRQQHEGASLGTMAVEFLRMDPCFSEARISLFCFGFEGWEGHPWKLERRLMLLYQYQGTLSLDSPFKLAEMIPVLDANARLVETTKNSYVIEHENLPGGQLAISGTGVNILEQTRNGADFEEICRSMRTEYPDAPENMDYDIASLFWTLEDLSLLSWAPGRAATYLVDK